MNASFVPVVQPCCAVLANNSNWQIEPPIGQLAAQLRPRIAARFGIRIDKAAFNCRNDRQRGREREREIETDSAAARGRHIASLLIGIPTQREQVAGLIKRVCVLSKRMLNACDKDVRVHRGCPDDRTSHITQANVRRSVCVFCRHIN